MSVVKEIRRNLCFVRIYKPVSSLPYTPIQLIFGREILFVYVVERHVFNLIELGKQIVLTDPPAGKCP